MNKKLTGEIFFDDLALIPFVDTVENNGKQSNIIPNITSTNISEEQRRVRFNIQQKNSTNNMNSDVKYSYASIVKKGIPTIKV